MNDDFKEELKDCYAEIDALRAEVERLTSGMQGACYACEPVGMLNQKLEAENARLREVLEKIATYEPDDGCPCSACRHSTLARAALAAQKEKTDE